MLVESTWGPVIFNGRDAIYKIYVFVFFNGESVNHSHIIGHHNRSFEISEFTNLEITLIYTNIHTCLSYTFIMYIHYILLYI